MSLLSAVPILEKVLSVRRTRRIHDAVLSRFRMDPKSGPQVFCYTRYGGVSRFDGLEEGVTVDVLEDRDGSGVNEAYRKLVSGDYDTVILDCVAGDGNEIQLDYLLQGLVCETVADRMVPEVLRRRIPVVSVVGSLRTQGLSERLAAYESYGIPILLGTRTFDDDGCRMISTPPIYRA